MRVLLDIKAARGDTDCPPGKQFYRCAANSFRGCCSVDACDYPDCPDMLQAAEGQPPSSTSSNTQLTSVYLIPFPPITIDKTSTINAGTAMLPQKATSSQNSIPEPASQPGAVLTSSTAASDSSQSTGTSSTKIDTGPVVGIVIGVIVFLILVIFTVFVIWKRRQINQRHRDESDTNCPAMQHSSADDKILYIPAEQPEIDDRVSAFQGKGAAPLTF